MSIELTPPNVEDTLTPGINPLADSLMRVATDDWQKAEILFKKRDDDLLIDAVRVTL